MYPKEDMIRLALYILKAAGGDLNLALERSRFLAGSNCVGFLRLSSVIKYLHQEIGR